MKHFPKGAHDDGLDALEMAFRLCKNIYPDPGVASFDSECYKELRFLFPFPDEDFEDIP